MVSCVSADPASRPSASWCARLAYLKSRGYGEGDPWVVECREALAYWRVHKSIGAEAGQLSRPGADRLIAELKAVAC